MIDQFRSIIDFGLVVLIWLVQLIIYPSFLYTDRTRLQEWHQKYTKRISVIVVPLMFGQVALIVTQIFLNLKMLTVFSLLATLFVWFFTFFLSVPIHEKISGGRFNDLLLKKLISTNWPRTALWTIIFILGMM